MIINDNELKKYGLGVSLLEYLAHIDGERKQLLKEHLSETALLAGKFANQFGKSDWGDCCGVLHDMGKYSIGFQ